MGIVHFYLSLCHARQGQWGQVKGERQACLDAFGTAQCQDLVATFVGSMGEVLVALEDWGALDQQVRTWQELHADDPVNLAQDWSWLAVLAQHRQEWGRVVSCIERIKKRSKPYTIS